MEEEKIARFRELFKELSPSTQSREVFRLLRIIKGKPAVIAEPIEEPDRKYKFQNVEHMVTWLKSGQFPGAHCSNVYKVLRQERASAYGFIIRYENEGGISNE